MNAVAQAGVAAFRHKGIVALVATALYVLLVLPVNKAIYFKLPFDAQSKVLNFAILEAVFAGLLFILIYYVLVFIERLRAPDATYWCWLKVSCAYLIVNGLVLGLIWPGFWVWDEFVVLEDVQQGALPAWQGVFTSIYYVMCLFLIPTGVGIVIVQAVAASVVVGYVVAKTAEMLTRKWLSLLLMIPFVFLPVLLNNFYPLRLTLYSYLEVLVFFQLILMAKGRTRDRNLYIELIALSALTTLLAFWRTEGALFLVLIPVFILSSGVFQAPGRRLLASATAIVCIGIVVGAFGLTNATSDPRYQITASLNPLSVMLQKPLAGENLDENLAAIDRVVDLDIVRSQPSANGIPSFWNGAVRPDFETHLGEYNRAFLALALSNPVEFISARTETFLSANSLRWRTPHILEATMYLDPEPLADVARGTSKFERNNLLADPVDAATRNQTVRALLMVNSENQPTRAGTLVWSVIPVIALLGAAFCFTLITRRWMYSGIIALILVASAIVFLTAPAAVFMYYLPAYLAGWVLIFHAGLVVLDRNFGSSERRFESRRSVVEPSKIG